jgi:hypothetical protein
MAASGCLAFGLSVRARSRDPRRECAESRSPSEGRGKDAAGTCQ